MTESPQESGTALFAHGNCRSLDEARGWAKEAVASNLRGSYPSACVVLAMEIDRLRAALAAVPQPSPEGGEAEREALRAAAQDVCAEATAMPGLLGGVDPSIRAVPAERIAKLRAALARKETPPCK